MNTETNQKGFTLIELLVVVAIIGILSSVVLASLNTARAKGSDAAVQAAMHNLQQQAENYFDSNSYSYNATGATSTTCTAASTVFNDPSATAIIKNIMLNAAATSSVVCYSTASNYAVSALLKGSGKNWCVDSNNNVTTSTVNTLDSLCI